MKLVEKIEIQSEELFGAYEDVIINGCGCGIATKDDMISIAATSKIEAVYIACVEYIKWYNSHLCSYCGRYDDIVGTHNIDTCEECALNID